jgi:hypothetical protein
LLAPNVASMGCSSTCRRPTSFKPITGRSLRRSSLGCAKPADSSPLRSTAPRERTDSGLSQELPSGSCMERGSGFSGRGLRTMLLKTGCSTVPRSGLPCRRACQASSSLRASRRQSPSWACRGRHQACRCIWCPERSSSIGRTSLMPACALGRRPGGIERRRIVLEGTVQTAKSGTETAYQLPPPPPPKPPPLNPPPPENPLPPLDEDVRGGVVAAAPMPSVAERSSFAKLFMLNAV